MSKLDEDVAASWNDSHPAGPERIIAWRKTVAELRAGGTLLPSRVEP